MAFDLNKNLIQMRTWFRYFMVLGTLVDIETGKVLETSNRKVKVDNAATDGKKMVVNPEFMAELSGGQQNFILCRMILAVARRQHLMRQGRDESLWNIACEQVILNELAQYVEFCKKNNGVVPMDLPPNLIIEKAFQGKSEAEVYQMLIQSGGGKGKGKQDGKNPLGKGGTQTGVVVDGKAIVSPEKLQEEVNRITRIVNSAEAQAGRLNSYWTKISELFEDCGPDPEALLHRFVTNCLPTARSWRRPDTRIWSMGQYYPGIIKNSVGELVMLTDCSGSMPRETVQECLGWIQSACQKCRPEKVHVVYFTSQIDHVDVFKWSESFEAPAKIPNGGTDFSAALRYVDSVNPKAVIWLTDGECSFPPEPGIPTLWLMTTNIVAPYGETIPFKTKL